MGTAVEARMRAAGRELAPPLGPRRARAARARAPPRAAAAAVSAAAASVYGEGAAPLLAAAGRAIDAALVGSVALPSDGQIIEYDAGKRRKPHEEVRQVVTLGGERGDEKRPGRLPWPRGIVFYEEGFGPKAKDAPPREEGSPAAPGCLVRPVRADIRALAAEWEASEAGVAVALTMELEAAGFRGDRGSVWVMERFGEMLESESTRAAARGALSAMSVLAADGCTMVGVAAVERDEHERLAERAGAAGGWRQVPSLAPLFGEHGLIVQALPCEELPEAQELDAAGAGPDDVRVPYVFTAKQMRLSEAQVEAVHAAVGEADDWADEDGFEDNLR